MWGKVLLLFLGAISIGYSAWSLWGQYQTGFRDFSVLPILVKFVAVWLLVTILGVWNTIQALRMAHRAWLGQLPRPARSQ